MTNTINFFVATHFCEKLKWASRGPGNKKQWSCISWVQHGAKPRAPSHLLLVTAALHEKLSKCFNYVLNIYTLHMFEQENPC